MALKAFAPQLQTTFVKALSDPSKQTRNKAIHALGKLMAISTRVDPLLTELAGQCTVAESNAIRCSTIDALAIVLDKGGHLATAPVLDKVKGAIFGHIVDEDESMRQSAAGVCGRLAAYLDGVGVGDLVLDLADLRALEHPTPAVCGRCTSIGAIAQHAGKKIDAVREDFYSFFRATLGEDSKPAVLNATCAALLSCLTLPTHSGSQERTQEYNECVALVLAEFAPALCKNSTAARSEETRRLAMTALKIACKTAPDVARKFASVIMPVVLEAWRDINLRVRAVADRLFYNLSDGGAAGHVSAFCQICSGEDSAFLRNYAKTTIARMSAEEEEEAW